MLLMNGKFHGFNTKKSIADLSIDEDFVKDLVDMLSFSIL
jgi:hypothetical protein